jgi:DNA-binding MarR family transcriptional regulator
MRLSKQLTPFAAFNSREVSCNTLILFLLIGERGTDGILQADIPKFLPMSRASVSRNCCLLGNKTHKNQKGMGLIERDMLPNQSKLIHLTLSETGKKLYAQITSASSDKLH